MLAELKFLSNVRYNVYYFKNTHSMIQLNIRVPLLTQSINSHEMLLEV